jgi:hypothetical protein
LPVHLPSKITLLAMACLIGTFFHQIGPTPGVLVSLATGIHWVGNLTSCFIRQLIVNHGQILLTYQRSHHKWIPNRNRQPGDRGVRQAETSAHGTFLYLKRLQERRCAEFQRDGSLDSRQAEERPPYKSEDAIDRADVL